MKRTILVMIALFLFSSLALGSPSKWPWNTTPKGYHHLIASKRLKMRCSPVVNLCHLYDRVTGYKLTNWFIYPARSHDLCGTVYKELCRVRWYRKPVRR